MTLWPPVFNIALNPGLVFFNRAQRHPAVSQIFQDICWPFTILSFDYVLKLGLEAGNDEYIILCGKGFPQHERFLSYSMSSFSSRRKRKKIIGLNRIKDFLLLIIIMKSSKILTSFVDKRRHDLFPELENGKITRTPSLFLHSSIFFSSITLCHFYFLVKNDFNPVQTGLCFASCDRETLRGPPL